MDFKKLIRSAGEQASSLTKKAVALVKGEKPEEGKKDSGHYLTGREIREIAAANKKVMLRLEKAKHRKAPESEFVTEMKDEKSILEIEDLHT